MATIDPQFFAREIRAAFEVRSNAEQLKKQNWIEIEQSMMELITTSHYLAKGK